MSIGIDINCFDENYLLYPNEEFLDEAYLGDIEYFNDNFLKTNFKELESIKDPDLKSKKIAQLIAKMITNIGNTCTKSINLKNLFKLSYKYNNIISKYTDKYITYVNDKDKLIIKKSIDGLLVGDSKDNLIRFAVGTISNILVPKEIGFIKNAYQNARNDENSIVNKFILKNSENKYSVEKHKALDSGKSLEDAMEIGQRAGTNTYEGLHGLFDKSEKVVTNMVRFIPKKIIQTIFFEICPIKFMHIGQALITYKQSSKYNKFVSDHTRKGAQYCFNITFEVMQDILKVYKDI